ncbi:MAG: FMN-binding negative transcriptional regulator, partial [Betaproteobacteria bacterium]|nr:FMN-binding negative transcriptional regulator [Betaproteobacteria bacterium]
MYVPRLFREDNPEVIATLMRQHPLASLVTLGPDGLELSPVPLLYDPTPRPDASHGVLRGHLARANPQWQHFNPDVPALAIFTGPNAYISPNWYPSKAEHGKAVPTWNYAVVEAQGPLRVIDEKDETREELRSLLTELTAIHEGSQSHAWKLEDAPEDYLAAQLKAVVGIELVVTKLTGKWKMSQNRSETDREGVK